MVGKTLGHYEILEPLGAGGMGEVYRARDTKLDRDVAIKVLPEDFATDPDRLARFEREAKLLASMNHANIAAIYGLEDEGDQRFIAMELVEGETLAERISRSGPIEVDEALDIARQIAEALEAAHENGVIHRDLKPANVIVTADGKAKVLDFGLAKAYEEDAAASDVSPDLSRSPTMMEATRAGLIMGTASYMSPEQAKGKPLDRRSDIWSFGCLLYEMLTACSAFRGEDVSETLAAILKDQPDWNALPATLPFTAQALLRRCLRKDSNRRLHDIADARIEIEEAIADPMGDSGSPMAPGEAGSRRIPLTLVLPIGVALMAATALAVWSVAGPTTPAASDIGLYASIETPPLRPTGTQKVSISPDGTRLAFVATNAENTNQVFVRHFDQPNVEPIAGTEGAETVFFSPDGESLAYVHARTDTINIVSLRGGPPTQIFDALTSFRGADWGGDWIVFTPNYSDGLWRVPAAGGAVEVLTKLREGEKTHRAPHVLPGGNTVLFTIGTAELPTFDDAPIAVVLLPSREIRILPITGMFPRYSPTGHIVYGQAGALMAVPFDIDNLVVTGSPVEVLGSTYTNPSNGYAQFSLSSTGRLAYLPAETAPPSPLSWIARDGTAETIPLPPNVYISPTVSPVGDRLAMFILGANSNLGIYGAAEGFRRISLPWDQEAPVFHPDGETLTYRHVEAGRWSIVSRRIDGSEDARELVSGNRLLTPGSWHPDGVLLAYTEGSLADSQIMLYDAGEGRSELWHGATRIGDTPRFSRDGQWLAYSANLYGSYEIYVELASESGSLVKVSPSGGVLPRWSPDSAEIYYVKDGHLMAVPLVISGSTIEPGPARRVVEGPVPRFGVGNDGRILMAKQSVVNPLTHINVITNWFEELNERVPTGGR